MVFLNSPCRETPKNVLKKKVKEKKSRMVGGWVWDLVNVRGGPSIFFGRPLGSVIGYIRGAAGMIAGVKKGAAV
jgi:hypothetical protein